MHLIHSQPFSLDLPTLGLYGVEPGVPVDVPDAAAEQLLAQGFEPAEPAHETAKES